MIADRLDREFLALDHDVVLDVLRGDPVEILTFEKRHDVIAQVGSDGKAMGLLAPAQLERL